jgi:drug/metabolite transporter (DMT)-like permease
MANPTSTKINHVQNPMLGLLLAAMAGLLFVSMDTIAKLATQGLAVEMVVWGRYAFHVLVMLILFPGRRLVPLTQTTRPIPLIARGVLLLGCTFCFFLALSHIPLADATAITFSEPLLAVALSIPLLGERVGIRRWTAVIIGWLGVMVIIRPGFQDVHWAYFLVLGVAVMFSLYAILTRRLSQTEDPMTMLFYMGVTGFIGSTIMILFSWQTPTLAQWGMMATIGVIGGVSHLIIIYAYRLAEVSLVAPFMYLNLLWAVGLGYLVFGDLPDQLTLLGAFIVAVCGLYVFFRETQLKRLQETDSEESEG